MRVKEQDTCPKSTRLVDISSGGLFKYPDGKKIYMKCWVGSHEYVNVDRGHIVVIGLHNGGVYGAQPGRRVIRVAQEGTLIVTEA